MERKLRTLLPNKNKKGAIGIIIFFLVLMTILIIGFFAAMLMATIDFVSDEVTPIMTDLGVVGNTNLSQVGDYTFGATNKVVQALPWVVAFGYAMALIFTLVFIFIVGYNPHPAFIGFYIGLMVLLVFLCIIMSNMYQDIYNGDDEIASRLKEQTILSYLILHSPFIMSFIAIIGAILMFTRHGISEGGGVGGFGV